MVKRNMKTNKNGFLQNGDKLVMVQVGNDIFALQHYQTVDARMLNILLDKHDVRLLKDKEY